MTHCDNPAAEIKVLIVDDHAIVRQGISQFLRLQAEFRLVGAAQNSAEAIALVGEMAPDVVLMDLVMQQQLAGIEATIAIKALRPATQVIILTSYHDDKMIIPALDAGAISYLLKDIAPEELLNAIRLAAKGQAVLSPLVATRLLQIQFKPGQSLTEREIAILKLVATGYNNAEIAGQLFIAIKTVRTHVSHILAKLQLRDRTQAAVHAWKHGLM